MMPMVVAPRAIVADAARAVMGQDHAAAAAQRAMNARAAISTYERSAKRNALGLEMTAYVIVQLKIIDRVIRKGILRLRTLTAR
jgi:hypothetical protein